MNFVHVSWPEVEFCHFVCLFVASPASHQVSLHLKQWSKFLQSKQYNQTILYVLTLIWTVESTRDAISSSYYGWSCSSAVFAWKRGIWVIVLKRKCLCIKYSNVLAILSYFWLILPIVRHCTAYGCSNRSNKVRWENLSWHKHRSKLGIIGLVAPLRLRRQRARFGGLFRNGNSWNKPNSCSFSGYSHCRVAVKPS